MTAGNIFRKLGGGILCIIGAYLLFLEVALGIGESHALADPVNVLTLSFFVFVGAGIAVGGVALFRSRKEPTA